MPSKYGNESKDRLESFLSAGTQAGLANALAMEFVVVNASLWRCEAPWNVPERRICDNLALFVADGALDICVEGRKAVLRKGSCAFIPERAAHSYGFHRGCSSCENFIVHLLPLAPSAENVFSCFDSPFQALRHPGYVLDALRKGVAMRNFNETAAFAYVADVLKGIIIDSVCEGRFRSVNLNSHAVSRLKAAYEFMHGNYANEIGVGDLAKAAGLKEVQFRKLFKKETGFAPNAYLRRLRLLHAARVLMRYDMSLSEIAAESGFHSVSYFCSSFLRFFKRSPGAFREEFKASR